MGPDNSLKLVKDKVRLPPELISWIDSGGTFPEQLELQETGNQIKSFDILERDDRGRIAGLADRHGVKGFVLKVLDHASGMVYAAKLCHPDEYTVRNESDEAHYLARLHKTPQFFALPRYVGRVARLDSMPPLPFEHFVCFIGDWVEGQSLDKFLARRPDEVSITFTLEVATALNRALAALARHGLKHDDLHSGNVMIETLSQDEILVEEDARQVRVKVVDGGSIKPIGTPGVKLDDDKLYYIKILIELRNRLHRNRAQATANPIFLNQLDTLIRGLLEEDPQRSDVADYPEIQQAIEQLRTAPSGPGRTKAKLSDPFEVISAEQLASDQLLLDLFTGGMAWYDTVRSKTPTRVTGPRGCGKSMVFRYLALKTHLNAEHSGIEAILELPFIGIYISCASELQNSLSWISLEENGPQRHRDKVVTYFQLILVRELLRTVSLIRRRPTVAATLGISAAVEQGLCNFIEAELPKELRPSRFSGSHSSAPLADALDRARSKLLRQMMSTEHPSLLWSESLLGDVTSKLMELTGITERPVAFILDDFTRYRVPLEVQKILNRVIWERRGSHVFKISCEHFGFEDQDLYQAQSDPEREYVAVDVGAQTLREWSKDEADESNKNSRKLASRFVEDLIDARMKAADWPHSAATLIGYCDYKSYIGLARALKEEAGKRTPFYHGLDVIADLFCGDVATVLQVVRSMCRRGKIGRDSRDAIAKTTQHEAIMEVSGRYVKRAEQFHPYGKELAEIARTFCSLMHDVLIKGKALGDQKMPRMIPRIELTLRDGREVLEHIKERDVRAFEIARECLRRSIFFELNESRPKNQDRGGQRTVRWEIRRIYVPQAAAAFGKNHYFDVKDVAGLVDLFLDPSKFKRVQLAANMDGPEVQRRLL